MPCPTTRTSRGLPSSARGLQRPDESLRGRPPAAGRVPIEALRAPDDHAVGERTGGLKLERPVLGIEVLVLPGGLVVILRPQIDEDRFAGSERPVLGHLG